MAYCGCWYSHFFFPQLCVPFFPLTFVSSEVGSTSSPPPSLWICPTIMILPTFHSCIITQIHLWRRDEEFALRGKGGIPKKNSLPSFLCSSLIYWLQFENGCYTYHYWGLCGVCIRNMKSEIFLSLSKKAVLFSLLQIIWQFPAGHCVSVDPRHWASLGSILYLTNLGKEPLPPCYLSGLNDNDRADWWL